MPREGRNFYIEIALFYGIAFLELVLDQLSKYYITSLFNQNQSTIPIIKNILHVTQVLNQGAAFGLLNKYSYVFIGAALVAIVVINYFLLAHYSLFTVRGKIALVLIFGGTLGNLVDRLQFGYVRDFIDLRIWPVFNIADSFITIGSVLLALSFFRIFKKLKLK